MKINVNFYSISTKHYGLPDTLINTNYVRIFQRLHNVHRNKLSFRVPQISVSIQQPIP